MGVIQCGAFTGSTAITTGWEPQFVMFKRIDSTGDWIMIDSSRGCAVGGVDAILNANLSSAESSTDYIDFTATGFITKGLTGNYIYTVVRRSNKPPTTGTQVYNAIARTGTGAAATVTGVGFAPDLCITKKRSSTTLTGARFTDRLRGKTIHLDSTATTAEVTTADTVTGFDVMDGFVLGADATTSAFNTSGHTYVNHFFKRAQGVFDVVCYTGTGVAKTEAHGLGVVPELIIVKTRNISGPQWYVGTSASYGILNKTDAFGPTTNTFTDTTILALIGVIAGNTNVSYLFATKIGVSKVGSYTGNGTSQTINCGFTTGSRFILIKRTDSTGDWYVWDSVRGIIAGNDPHLSLNTTAAEVATDDSIDPNILGFDVVQNSSTNINVTSGTYIFLAFA